LAAAAAPAHSFTPARAAPAAPLAGRGQGTAPSERGHHRPAVPPASTGPGAAAGGNAGGGTVVASTVSAVGTPSLAAGAVVTPGDITRAGRTTSMPALPG
jgi:hypothetical protein